MTDLTRRTSDELTRIERAISRIASSYPRWGKGAEAALGAIEDLRNQLNRGGGNGHNQGGS